MGRPARKPSPEPVVEFFWDIVQGSEAWENIRIGLPTASNFSKIMAEAKDGETRKMRDQYMRKLCGEILTGVPAENFRNSAMDRGIEQEPEAREHYARTNLVILKQVGFVRRRLPSGRYVGASPDSIVSDRKALEIKTLKPELLIDRLERGAGMPPEHKWQVYGTMWVADLQEVDLMLYYRGMPVSPKFTAVRNEATIKELSDAVETFDWELAKLVKKIRDMGT